jgi:hypothetical protein
MLNERWRDQYERMQRSHALFRQVGESTRLPQELIAARDVLFHFCCDVLHLRDWILAVFDDDPEKQALTAELKLLLTTPELAACRDIANGFKHFRLSGESYLTGTRVGHAKVVQHNIIISPAPARLHAEMLQPTLNESDTEAASKPKRVSRGETSPIEAGGYTQDTFKADIAGDVCDMQYVVSKAVAAWDDWLNGDSQFAVKLRTAE